MKRLVVLVMLAGCANKSRSTAADASVPTIAVDASDGSVRVGNVPAVDRANAGCTSVQLHGAWWVRGGEPIARDADQRLVALDVEYRGAARIMEDVYDEAGHASGDPGWVKLGPDGTPFNRRYTMRKRGGDGAPIDERHVLVAAVSKDTKSVVVRFASGCVLDAAPREDGPVWPPMPETAVERWQHRGGKIEAILRVEHSMLGEPIAPMLQRPKVARAPGGPDAALPTVAGDDQMTAGEVVPVDAQNAPLEDASQRNEHRYVARYAWKDAPLPTEFACGKGFCALGPSQPWDVSPALESALDASARRRVRLGRGNDEDDLASIEHLGVGGFQRSKRDAKGR